MLPAFVLLSSLLRRTLVLHNIYHQLLAAAIVSIVFFTSCSSTQKPFNPNKKLSIQQLQQDYTIFQNILEERHPGLYWYTPKASIDSSFNASYQLLRDSMTEQQFRKVLALAVSNIQCGHTSIRASNAYQKYSDTVKGSPLFPFNLKLWNDSAALISSVYKNIPIVRGDIIDSINHKSIKQLLDTMYRFMPADGGSAIAKNQLLSSGNNFGTMYTAIFGWQKQFNISYFDSSQIKRYIKLNSLVEKKDSASKAEKKQIAKKKKTPKAERLKAARHLEIHADSSYALMSVNSFLGKLQLKRFFHSSFKTLAQQQIPNLIIDLRLNGGGRIDNANYLIRRLTSQKYQMGDSVYAIAEKSKYSKYIKGDFWYSLLINIFTKRIGGQYHYTFLEKRYNKPKEKNRFLGHVYLLSGGRTFSASTVVLNFLKNQPNVTIVGEPSGGAAYGNCAMQLPIAVLPNSGLRLRFPLFRYVMNKNLPHDGKGVQPDIYIGTNIDAIRKGEDYKMERVKQMTMERN